MKRNTLKGKTYVQREIDKKIRAYEEEFKNFMGIKEFPIYEIQTQEVTQTIVDSKGYGIAACTLYQPQNKHHTLRVSTNLILSKYLMFHEFTHILDSEMYVKGDKGRYVGLSGFTEYHASQIELVQLLGVNTIDQAFTFSMNKTITTMVGEKSVYQYVEEKHQHAISLFKRDDFPIDENALITAVGVIYNYLGLRSICEMYSIDYVETINNEVFLKFIPTQYFVALNNLMHGWLSEKDIDMSINVYINIITLLINKFKLE